MNLSKKKCSLCLKEYGFAAVQHSFFFQAAFKDPKMSPFIRGHSKGVRFLGVQFFGCGFRGLRLRFSKNAHFWVFLEVKFFRGVVFYGYGFLGVRY